MKNNEIRKFQNNGFLELNFKETESFNNLNNILKDISNEKIKQGWFLKEKYVSTKDIRPLAYNYDASILDILEDNNIKSTLNTVTQRNLHLCHVQIRTSLPGSS